MVTVGVTGHRDLPDSADITQAVDSVLSHIQSIYGHTDLQLISPLAEGADRLVAWQAVDSYSARLIVPLPLDISNYLQDFETPVSREEFRKLMKLAEEVIQMPAANSRTAGYLAAGRYTLRHSDVLIAVWDGKYNGRVGGTGQIVAEARQQELPMAWIQVKDRGVPGEKSIQKDNDSTVRVIYERFPPAKDKAGGR